MKYNIPVFESEIKDGLADAIQASTSVAYLSPLSVLAKETPLAKLRYQKAAAQNEGQFDLFYMKDILASTGWNKNDDVFDRKRTWEARASAIDKQFNFEHNPLDIIGHITSAEVVDDEMNVIADDTKFEDLPEKFHILTGSVIYRYLGDEDRDKLIEKTIAEIINGDWFVSMECLFQGFDYALIDSNGNHGVIERTEASAFLTKHLRAYKGTGKYFDKSTGAEYKLGRLMKIKTFSGKGLVRAPGNENSVVLSTQTFDPAYANQVYNIVDKTVSKMETNKMSDTIDALKPLQDELATARATIKDLEKTIRETDSKAHASTIDGLKADIVTKDAQISAITSDITASTAALTEAKASLTTVSAELETAKAELVTVKAELAIAKAATLKAGRVAEMIEKGASAEKAAELAEKFAAFSPEQFASTIEVLSPAWAAAASPSPAPKVETATASEVLKEVAETARASQENVALNTVTEPKAPLSKSVARHIQRYLRVNGDVDIDGN